VVHLVEVDVVGLEPAEAGLAGAPDVEGGEATIVRPQAHGLVCLGRQHDVLAPATALQPPADDVFGGAVALCHVGGLGSPVHIRGIDEVDALLDRGIQDLEAG
jgi:hypothetical protein